MYLFEFILFKHVPNYSHESVSKVSYNELQILIKELSNYLQEILISNEFNKIANKYNMNEYVHEDFIKEINSNWHKIKEPFSKLLEAFVRWISSYISQKGVLTIIGM